MNIKIYKEADWVRLCVVIYESKEDSVITSLRRPIITRNLPVELDTPKLVDNSLLYDIDDSLAVSRLEVLNKYNTKITELESKLVNTKDFNDEHERDVFSLKKRIQTVAGRLSEADLDNEDESFGNLLYELGQLKKQLGSFKNEYKDIARKQNGTIKYEISKIRKEMDFKLALLDLDMLYEVVGAKDR